MFDYNALKKQLIVDEDLRLHAYPDSKGNITVGVGRNLSRGGPGLTVEEADYLLDNDLGRVELELDDALPWWRQMNGERQGVLMNMCFNLGIGTLLTFHNTLDAMKNGNYEGAAEGMEASQWYKQVGARASRLVTRMRKG